MRVGLQHLRRWVQLAIFADEGGDGPALNNPLMDMAAARAAFMEELARLELSDNRLLRHAQPDEAFMVGILSMLKDVYDISMSDIVRNLNVTDEIQDALLNHGGDLGSLLSVSEMMERLELKEAADCLQRMGVSSQAALECQKKAYAWRNKLA
jgi:EAL and modified HD-GYP domain-containing signal transduction protein